MTNKKQTKTIKIFTHTIQYLKNHILNTLKQQNTKIKTKNIN